MPTNYIDKILQAKVYDVAKVTPLDYAPSLSQRLHNKVWIKREDLQPVFSFKLRGAYNKLVNLSDVELQKGVITASAGNHAQGVALSAQYLGVKALIVMPETTPEIKISAARNFGAEIILHGDTYDEACLEARRLSAENQMTFIHPYDDVDVIAGQGTVAMEILRQHEGLIDIIFIPVGGGGLIAGMATYIKSLRPDIRVIGVESDESACLQLALKDKKRTVLSQVGLFADGVAVRQIGEEPFRLASQFVDDVITVSTDEICAAIMDIFDDTRSIAEPAGALAVAGMKKYVTENNVSDNTLIAIESGANINFDRLRHVAERAEIGEHREILLAVTIAEEPGSFLHFCKVLTKRNVTEFNYRYADHGQAHVFVGVQVVSGASEREQIIEDLRALSYVVIDMTENEMAKTHIRYMVGGHAVSAKDERLYRFEFPERPGALLRFLTKLGVRWNISLFHYRNHGAAYGRVLVGIQVPASSEVAFQTFLKGLGYSYWEETDNPAYTIFLGDCSNTSR